MVLGLQRSEVCMKNIHITSSVVSTYFSCFGCPRRQRQTERSLGNTDISVAVVFTVSFTAAYSAGNLPHDVSAYN